MYFLPQPLHGPQSCTDILTECIVSSWNELYLRKHKFNELMSPLPGENKEMLYCSLKLAAFNSITRTFDEFYNEIMRQKTIKVVRTIVTDLPVGVSSNPRQPYMRGKGLHEVIRGYLCYVGGRIRAAIMKVWSDFKMVYIPGSDSQIDCITEAILEERVKTLRDKNRDEMYNELIRTFVDPTRRHTHDGPNAESGVRR